MRYCNVCPPTHPPPPGTVQPLPGPINYTSPTDSLVLEDESGRVNLTHLPTSSSSLPVGEYVTGLVVAVSGQAEGGNFVVEDVCVAGLPPQQHKEEEEEGEEPRYVLLASGPSPPTHPPNPKVQHLIPTASSSSTQSTHVERPTTQPHTHTPTHQQAFNSPRRRTSSRFRCSLTTSKDTWVPRRTRRR